MNTQIQIGTSKSTGESYRYMLKVSWQTRYYSCELATDNPTWLKSLSEAKHLAESKGVLVRVVMTRPELKTAFDYLTSVATHIQSQVTAINQLLGDMTDDQIETRSNLWDASAIIEHCRGEVKSEIFSAYQVAA